MRHGIPFLSVVAGAGCLVVACATGSTNGVLDDGSTDGGPSGYLPAAGKDAAARDAQPPPQAADAATVATPDAGKDAAVVDSGPPPGGGDCVGTMSAQLSSTYDDACDNYYFNVGTDNACSPGGTSCAALDTATLTFCCYKPPVGSNCWFDYFAQPQCIPK
jgi:hypothetical protein